MSELAWDDTDVTVVKRRSATVEPPDLPTLVPPNMDAADLAKTEVRDGDAPDLAKTEVRDESNRAEEPAPAPPLEPAAPPLPLAPGPQPLPEAKIGILPPRRYVSQLAITEVEGDERDTWTFLKSTVAIPMVKATQALPLVRVRRRRLINTLPWAAMIVGAISGVVLCWWLTLPKTEPVVTALAPAQASVQRSVAGLFVDGPVGVRVEVDGVDRGALPLRLDGLRPGEHHLRFDGRPDRGVLKRDVVLEGGRVAELEPVAL